MTDLIPALAAAHAALLTQPEQTPLMTSTAKKIEASLVEALACCNDAQRDKLSNVIINSGSLKALKMIPENLERSKIFFKDRLNHLFIIKQNPAYIREALKRGFFIDNQQRLEIFRQLATEPNAKSRKQKEAILLTLHEDGYTNSTSQFAAIVIREMLDMKDAAPSMAPLAAKILKQCFKSSKDPINRDFARMLTLYSPGAASDIYYRAIATYALLGAARPNSATFEDHEIEHLAKTITSKDGRRALREETGGLEAWLAGGHRTPPSIISEFENKRKAWRPACTARPKPMGYISWR